jgi:hypothetical protein
MIRVPYNPPDARRKQRARAWLVGSGRERNDVACVHIDVADLEDSLLSEPCKNVGQDCLYASMPVSRAGAGTSNMRISSEWFARTPSRSFARTAAA